MFLVVSDFPERVSMAVLNKSEQAPSKKESFQQYEIQPHPSKEKHFTRCVSRTADLRTAAALCCYSA